MVVTLFFCLIYLHVSHRRKLGVSCLRWIGKADDLHPRELEEAVEIVDTLMVIFQNSIDSGMVAADWKVVNVTPLFKEGERK